MEKFYIEFQNRQAPVLSRLLQATIAGLVLSTCTNIPPKIESKPETKQVEAQPDQKPGIIPPTLETKTTKDINNKKQNITFSHKGPLGDNICKFPDNTTRLCKPKPPKIMQTYTRDYPGEEIVKNGKIEIIPSKSEYCTVYESYNQKNGKNDPIKAKCITVKSKKSK